VVPAIRRARPRRPREWRGRGAEWLWCAAHGPGSVRSRPRFGADYTGRAAISDAYLTRVSDDRLETQRYV